MWVSRRHLSRQCACCEAWGLNSEPPPPARTHLQKPAAVCTSVTPAPERQRQNVFIHETEADDFSPALWLATSDYSPLLSL